MYKNYETSLLKFFVYYFSGGRRGGLFNDVQNLSRIWNHPFILVRIFVLNVLHAFNLEINGLSLFQQKAKERVKKSGDDEDSESDEVGSLKDFVVDR